MKMGDSVATKHGHSAQNNTRCKNEILCAGCAKCDAHGAHVENVLFWLIITGKVVLWEEKEDECCGKVWVFLIFS